MGTITGGRGPAAGGKGATGRLDKQPSSSTDIDSVPVSEISIMDWLSFSNSSSLTVDCTS